MIVRKSWLVAALLFLVIFVLVAAAPLASRSRFDWAIAKRLTVLSGGADFWSAVDMNAQVLQNIGADGTDFDSSGGLTLASGLTLSDGNATVADDFIVTAQTAISATNGGVITATGTYQPIESAGTVTPTIETSGFTAGDLLVLINTANTTINIVDSGTAKLSAAAALGQYDSLILWFDGTNWIEISRSNN